MKIVLDTNILISALMRDSTTRRLIVELDEELLYPELGLKEIQKHKDLILQRSGLSENEFNTVLDTLFEYIGLVPNNAIQGYVERAKAFMLPIDEKDVIFLATSMALEDTIIWSDDKHFKQQNKAKVKTTKEMLKDQQ
jgi:predicted nucleic acid-binding protein